MSYLIAFLGFSALIVLHEFGHFLVAKRTGMKATRFFLFFPPRLIGFKRGETEYGIGALPLGGFVKIIGMTPEEEVELSSGRKVDLDDPGHDLEPGELAELEDTRARAFCNQSASKRIAVIFAGPAVNLVIAFVLFFVVSAGFGLDETVNRVGSISKGLPAQGVLEPGDEILSIDGVDVSDLRGIELAEAIRAEVETHSCPGAQVEGCRSTTPVELVIAREGSEREVEIRPEFAIPRGEGIDPEEEGRMLIGFGYDVRAFEQPISTSLEFSVDRMWALTRDGVFGIVPRVFDSERRDEISSAVGIYEVTRQSIEFGTREALGTLGAISLVLAVMNLMPFLPLDGGHIAWALAERIRGRRIPLVTVAKFSSVGIVFLVFVVIIGLSNDIGRLTGEGFDLR